MEGSEALGGVAQAAVGLIFVASAVAKWLSPARTVEALSTIGVRTRPTWLVVVPLIAVELTLAAGLFLLDRTAAVLPALAVLVAFSAFLVYLARRAPAASCGCLGDVGYGGHKSGLVRNALLGGLLLVAWVSPAAQSWATVAVGAQAAIALIALTDGVAILLGLRRRNRIRLVSA